jgi:D-beta-D-heptose 7-phosphate kinase/D-beta-D-heptose 1-phosphate adenosyltransferase
MNVLTLDEARDQCDRWRADGQRIVFTNGVFDLLHRGHVTYLQAARDAGDRLVVGLNSDASVRTLGKGDDRPIVPQDDRAFIIAGLRSVDAVVIFDDPNPLKLIEALAPEILVKGGDYDPTCSDPSDPSYIVGRAEVLARGGSVKALDLVPGRSTTALANKLKG